MPAKAIVKDRMVSLHVAKGVNFRVAEMRVNTFPGPRCKCPIDHGQVFVTSQRVVFEHGRTTRERLFTRLLGAGASSDDHPVLLHVSNRQKARRAWSRDSSGPVSWPLAWRPDRTVRPRSRSAGVRPPRPTAGRSTAEPSSEARTASRPRPDMGRGAQSIFRRTEAADAIAEHRLVRPHHQPQIAVTARAPGQETAAGSRAGCTVSGVPHWVVGLAAVAVPSHWNVEDHAASLEAALRACGFGLLHPDLAQDVGFVAHCLPLGVGLRSRESRP
jgi:hypothetical protein